MLSAPLSFVLLRKQRDAMSEQIVAKVDRAKDRLAANRSQEDGRRPVGLDRHVRRPHSRTVRAQRARAVEHPLHGRALSAFPAEALAHGPPGNPKIFFGFLKVQVLTCSS